MNCMGSLIRRTEKGNVDLHACVMRGWAILSEHKIIRLARSRLAVRFPMGREIRMAATKKPCNRPLPTISSRTVLASTPTPHARVGTAAGQACFDADIRNTRRRHPDGGLGVPQS